MTRLFTLLAVFVFALFTFSISLSDAKASCHRHSRHNHKSHRHSNPVASASSSSDSSFPPANSTTDSSVSSSSSSSSSSSTSNSSTTSSTSSSSSSQYFTGRKPNHKKAGFTPNCKRGVSGGQSLRFIANHLCWYNDWHARRDNRYDSKLIYAPMLWGLGRLNHDDDEPRFHDFLNIPYGHYSYIMGFNEMDFHGNGSAGYVSPRDAARGWDRYIAPHGHAGSVLISPSMAKQKDEKWLQPFLDAVHTPPDVIAVHIFQPTIQGVKGVLEHYAKYNKPMWITEFACINYQVHPTVYCNQQQTNQLISQAVELFESDARVAAYAISDAYNGPYSYLETNQNGLKLSTTGRQYLDDLKAACKS